MLVLCDHTICSRPPAADNLTLPLIGATSKYEYTHDVILFGLRVVVQLPPMPCDRQPMAVRTCTVYIMT